jgi:hypothetical protein
MVKKTLVITEKRKGNLIKAYDWVKWDMTSLEISTVGLGDAPVFILWGAYDNFEVRYKSASRGGSVSSIAFFNNRQLKNKFFNGALKRSAENKKAIDKLRAENLI